MLRNYFLSLGLPCNLVNIPSETTLKKIDFSLPTVLSVSSFLFSHGILSNIYSFQWWNPILLVMHTATISASSYVHQFYYDYKTQVSWDFLSLLAEKIFLLFFYIDSWSLRVGVWCRQHIYDIVQFWVSVLFPSTSRRIFY